MKSVMLITSSLDRIFGCKPVPKAVGSREVIYATKPHQFQLDKTTGASVGEKATGLRSETVVKRGMLRSDFDHQQCPSGFELFPVRVR